MGSQTSKPIRKLPNASLSRPAPRSQIPRREIPPFERSSSEKELVSSPGPLDYGVRKEYDRDGTPRNEDVKHVNGEKNDAILKDAMDPQFLQNLHKLGPVQVNDAGKLIPVNAQRTLLARKAEYTSSSLPLPGHLTLPVLVTLLDRLKALPPGSDPSSLYKQFGMEKDKIEQVRRWVNSASVEEKDDVRVEEGNEIREMKSLWIGGLQSGRE
ncbi:uncharacterized protein L203_105630 [Cryptococcus depauperatus CBS 7841]|uniref:Uncharacterized protein n=1 Tax=Cryptococcus depauperatus CBS 7841 TaxID=1295531 RepID=A0A1E3IF39_9TREE|nr:hypothetical protein L203_03506 [Cryptococcus depauperatus CBS 7841]